MFDHFWRTPVFGEDVAEQLQPSRELSVEDPVWAMGFRQGSALIHDVATEVRCGELVLHLPDPPDVGVAKQIPNHRVGEGATDEVVHHQSYREFAAGSFE